MNDVTAWLRHPDADRFPYDAVLQDFHRCGKHFVAEDVLDELEQARAALPEAEGSAEGRRRLDLFFGSTLDKRDGSYDYPSYLATALLPIPGIHDARYRDDPVRARDRLVVHLIADALRFELAVSDGAESWLPQQQPDARTVGKRYRLGLRTIRPALNRLGLAVGVTADDPEAEARLVCEAVAADQTDTEQLALRLSMLPVYTIHDEYMFLRILQSFETTFGMITVQLQRAIDATQLGDPTTATAQLTCAESVLRESAPLFSMLATMQVESFRTFRNYTEGASAIQSRNYKLVESLCRTPDTERLSSPAYESVPEVRDRVLSRPGTLDDAVRHLRASGDCDEGELTRLLAAMERFEATLMSWRRTHYRLAVHMLGERTGTGYTQGPPYLAEVRTIPVFRSVRDVPGSMPIEDELEQLASGVTVHTVDTTLDTRLESTLERSRGRE